MAVASSTVFASNSDHEAFKQRGYKLGRKIGKGSFATVVLAKYSNDQTHQQIRLACKIVDKEKAPMDFLSKFFPRELDIITKLEHPNIIPLHSILQRGSKFFIFMKYAENGNLLDYIIKYGRINEKLCKEWFIQIINGVKYLHSMNIAHRDLKCENVLLSKRMNVKLADFGFARYYKRNTSAMSSTYCGSAAYAAPEVIIGKPYDPQLSDIWSIGIILFIMLNGTMPFEDSNVKKLLLDQKNKNLRFCNTDVISKECMEVLLNILAPEIKDRWSLEKIENSTWIKSKGDVMDIKQNF